MRSVNAGDEIVIKPTELVAGGDALARIDGFPIFASNVYPGDVALVRLYEVKKGFAKADLVRVIEPSPSRRVSPCPVADECGGCDWTALRLDQQLEAKRWILSESLRRIGKFDVSSLPPIAIHPSPLNYRIRSRLHRDGDAVGFYAMHSNRVVPLPRECEVVGVETAKNPVEGETWEVDGRLISQGGFMIEGYYVTTDAFFQVNRHLLRTMLRLVAVHADRIKKRDLAIDLYSGVGFFTVPLAKTFEQVIAVEGSRAAHECARRNVPGNVKLMNLPIEQYEMPEADFIFLDPPRAGARREVIRDAGDKARELVCYLSCDPVTFSRDANRLTASGWRLYTLDLLDLFPNTHHVETLASFERAP
ncbi:MAG TPA: hypothetical protein VGK31_03240 [Thermoanaerobaculia bacterium]